MKSGELIIKGWHPPAVGFEVDFSVSSTTHTPEEVTRAVGLQPTEARHAKMRVRKYNIWELKADSALSTIQEQIDNLLSLVEPYADRFRALNNCDVCLSIYIYPEIFEAYHDTHPSFSLEEKWIGLLERMHATFVLD